MKMQTDFFTQNEKGLELAGSIISDPDHLPFIPAALTDPWEDKTIGGIRYRTEIIEEDWS
jgi:hypothetical protein